jgi:hypothetical protein
MLDEPDETSLSRRDDEFIERYIESKNGWSRFRLELHDLSQRWQWWALVLLTRRLPPAAAFPYPKIVFADHLTTESPALKMIRACLRPFHADERAFDDLLDWLLFGFGDPETTGLAPSKAASFRHFAEAFDLAVLLEHPGDWIGHVYETEIASKWTKDASGFFSTPPAICKAMVQMAMHDVPLLTTVNEPCCGTGRMLLEASNYAVHLSGQDINPTLVKIAKVNGWLYMPSLVMPCPQLGTAGDVAAAQALHVEGTPPPAASATPAAAPAPTESILPPTNERTTTWTPAPLFPDS